MCPIPNGFRDRVISLYSSKIIDKEILRTVSNTGRYCSGDKVGTVYLVWCILENSIININALSNSCEDMACCSSVQWNSSISETVRYSTHVRIYTLFCLERPILWPPRILTFPSGAPVCMSRYSDGLHAGRPFRSGGKRFFSSPRCAGPALGPNHPHIQWEPGAKRQGREADQSLPYSAEVKNDGAIPPLSLMSSWNGA
jgi:hypothetical protein